MTNYRTLALGLHSLDAAHGDTVRAAEQAYASGLAAAEGEVANAESGVRLAESSVRVAAQHVADVDERSSRLWQELAALLGRRGRRLGPVPAPAVDLSETAYAGLLDAAATDPLDIAAETITRSAFGEPIAPVPRWMTVVLPPAGALAALAVALPVRGILAVIGGRLTLLHVLGEVLLFFAPFAGVPPLITWTRHRYGSWPDIGAIGLTALGGMIASCGIVLLFR
jgi:hypothetical protein